MTESRNDENFQKDFENRQKVLEKYQCDRIDTVIIQALLDFPSITNGELAVLAGCHRGKVAKRRKTEKFQKLLHEMTMAPMEMMKAKLCKLTARYLQYCEFATEESVGERAIAKVLVSFGILKPTGEMKDDAAVRQILVRHLDGTATELAFEKPVIESENGEVSKTS